MVFLRPASTTLRPRSLAKLILLVFLGDAYARSRGVPQDGDAPSALSLDLGNPPQPIRQSDADFGQLPSPVTQKPPFLGGSADVVFGEQQELTSPNESPMQVEPGIDGKQAGSQGPTDFPDRTDGPKGRPQNSRPFERPRGPKSQGPIDFPDRTDGPKGRPQSSRPFERPREPKGQSPIDFPDSTDGPKGRPQSSRPFERPREPKGQGPRLSKDSKFLIGVGKADITGPVVELVMAGYAHSDQVATGLRQRLYSRAFIIADAKDPRNRLLYVVLDNINSDASIRMSILDAFKAIPNGDLSVYNEHNFALSSVHSHSGPSYGWNYFLAQVPQSGFDMQGHRAIVDGALLSIKRAHMSLEEGHLDFATIEIEDASINRSKWAYLANPEEERDKYARDVDTTMTALRFRRASDGRTRGLLTWFPVHGTSLYGNNTHVSGDNKGLASWILEQKMRKLAPFTDDFVGAFGQANEADVSPNIGGAWCEDGSGQPCNMTDSSCPDGKVTKCLGRGPMFRALDLGVSSCHEIARRQAAKAEELMTSTKTAWKPIEARLGLKGYHFYHDMAWWNFTTTEGNKVMTCPAALGYSFAAGTTDGPGLFDFVQGDADKPRNPIWTFTFGVVKSPTRRQKICQVPKPVLFDGGETQYPYEWSPNIVDVAMFRIGQLFIILSPSEVTTMGGRRWRKAVGQEAETFMKPVRPIVVLAGPVNSYSHYLTTKEEYDIQRYEGASTLFGRWQLDAYMNLSVSSMHYLTPGSKDYPEQGKMPPDNRKRSFNANPGIAIDLAFRSSSYGEPVHQPDPQYVVGKDVQATFKGANPRNNLRLEDTYAAVEQLGSDGNWTRIRDDEDWFLVFTWRRNGYFFNRGEEVDITWETKGNAQPGTYRLKYYGDAKTATQVEPSVEDSSHLHTPPSTLPDPSTMEKSYDEFGNFLGEESDEASDASVDEADDDIDDDEQNEAQATSNLQLMEVDEGPSNAVVLHEDKQYYPTAQQVYGPDVDTRVEEEDALPLTKPIIAPVEVKKFKIEEADLPPVFFDRTFMSDLMNFPEQARNVALAGHLHHGKTSFMDMLVMETHDISERLNKRTGRKRDERLRYTDVHLMERERGISIKAAPMSLVLQNTRGKSHLINIIDTPGHVNFVDEIAASFRLVDGLCLVVDVVEGVQINTEQIIRHAVLEGLPMTLIINKMDRLILELRLPPKDAYFKLKHVIEEVNTAIANTVPGAKAVLNRVSPELGNVLFACTDLGWCFTLQSFAQMYSEKYGEVNAQDLAKRLWGDVYYNPEKRNFTRKPLESATPRSFVHFILEPIYKIFTHSITDSPVNLKKVLTSLGIELKPKQYKADAGVILKLVCQQFFGPCQCFVDMILQHVPSPGRGAQRLLEHHYTGPLDTKIVASMRSCDQDGPLMVHVTKLFSTTDAKSFLSLGRVLSGTARPGMAVRVLGEGYSADDEEDMTTAEIGQVLIAETRYNIVTDGVPAGSLVLLSGVDNSIVKSATIVGSNLGGEDAHIFRPVIHFTQSVLKVAVEPVNPSELPKMLDGLRKVQKSYPLIDTKVEESGEHIIMGTGELYMDCVLHDLRRLYADMDIKVSDPVTCFCETVVETSATKCYAITPNKKNRITMVAEQLDKGIATDIEAGVVKIRDPVRKTARYFEENHGWDKLAARSIWAFGPDEKGPNVLQDDTLPTEVDKKLLGTVRESIRQGFSWAAREGPLCEEPIRNTRFKVTDVVLANEAIYRGGGQVIPTSRRACYSSFLMASPRLMEPMYAVSVTGPEDSYMEAYNVLSRRRGHVVSDGPVAGTPLYRVNGLLPVIDSLGFETDLRIKTQGSSMVSMVFDGWNIVPGDPLDSEVTLRPLQPASTQATARDFMLKTRRRKGLSEDVSVKTFLEPEFYESLMASGLLGDA
ncbi:hypothetical protein L249_7870 [Ophiocordyceps polyrhachis-furcata BCC 54312]|uniref:116 kDa U5 small nuclear ribonucleoprotein component n=1 Tax=Ophiocordyceps polyrhachis-furcata BCC 54312 TaxID=1330021 RepID=A0A367L179_9HYPO|nr:hypothetical protein L249_7870 [Ophiocordyceps polyrhachis-furcata BCC 54312]